MKEIIIELIKLFYPDAEPKLTNWQAALILIGLLGVIVIVVFATS